MILTTTPNIEGKRVTRYLDIETVGVQGGMLMVSISGTAIAVQ